MDLPEAQLKRFMRGGSTAGTWNLIVDKRLFRLVRDGGLWRSFEVDPPHKGMKPLRAPTRRELIEAIRITAFQEI